MESRRDPSLHTRSPTSLPCMAFSPAHRLFDLNLRSAVRCDTDGLYVPPTVHLFLPRTPTGEWDSERIKRCCFTNDRKGYAGFVPTSSHQSSILHYAIWDPHALWAKYHLHGEFPDVIAGAALKGGMVWGDMFHTHCRDFYLQRRSDSDGGRAAMHKLFRKAAALEDPTEVERQIAAGVLCRVHAVPEVLGLELPQACGMKLGSMQGPQPRSADSDNDSDNNDSLLLEENEEEEDGLLLEDNSEREEGGGVLIEQNGGGDDSEEGGLLLEDNSEHESEEDGPLLEENFN